MTPGPPKSRFFHPNVLERYPFFDRAQRYQPSTSTPGRVQPRRVQARTRVKSIATYTGCHRWYSTTFKASRSCQADQTCLRTSKRPRYYLTVDAKTPRLQKHLAPEIPGCVRSTWKQILPLKKPTSCQVYFYAMRPTKLITRKGCVVTYEGKCPEKWYRAGILHIRRKPRYVVQFVQVLYKHLQDVETSYIYRNRRNVDTY